MKKVYVVIAKELDHHSDEKTVWVVGVYEYEAAANEVAKEQLNKPDIYGVNVSEHILL